MDRKLIDMVDDCIELTVSFPGGHFSVAGSVRLVVGEGSALWVGPCCLPLDAVVSKGYHVNVWKFYARETARAY